MSSRPLRGKVALITGGSQGLGLEISRKFLGAGASVVITARDSDQLARAKDEIQRGLSAEQAIEILSGDVSDALNAERFARFTLDRFGRIDVLVNNAGVYGPMGRVEDVDWRDWVRTIEINLLGSVLMCRAALPAMKEKRKGKILQLSGGGATSPMPFVSAYAVSKAAIVRFVDTLAEEVREFNIDVNAIAPGALNTRMLEEVLTAGPEMVGQAFYDRAIQQKQSGGVGLEKGADLAVFLASEVSDGITGKLISAVWDNWENWPEFVNELRQSDAYTLRRVAGRDRGLPQGDK